VKNKSYPFLIFVAAALLFFWVKKNQRGNQPGRVTVDAVKDDYFALRSGNKTIKYSLHAKCRMDCRHIDESEVKEILANGIINYNKEETTEKGITYPLEGITHDGQHVRIVFAPKEKEIVVVTAIDLDKDWPCGNCN
jgi:hypothetical protein